MNETLALTHITAHARDDGADMATLRALVEEASEAGAASALRRLGLSDEAAHKDIADLRELLSAWRDAKASARKAVIDWIVRGALALLLIGIAYKLGLATLLAGSGVHP
jgi:hypothetical protein